MMLPDRVAKCNAVQEFGHHYKLLRCGLTVIGCDLGTAIRRDLHTGAICMMLLSEGRHTAGSRCCNVFHKISVSSHYLHYTWHAS